MNVQRICSRDIVMTCITVPVAAVIRQLKKVQYIKKCCQAGPRSSVLARDATPRRKLRLQFAPHLQGIQKGFLSASSPTNTEPTELMNRMKKEREEKIEK